MHKRHSIVVTVRIGHIIIVVVVIAGREIIIVVVVIVVAIILELMITRRLIVVEVSPSVMLVFMDWHQQRTTKIGFILANQSRRAISIRSTFN